MKISKVILILATVTISMSMLIASTNAPLDVERVSATTLTGTVVDASTDEAIADAEVAVAEADTTIKTDEYGTFTFENLEEGTVTVTVNAEGYSTAEEEVEITKEGASVEFALEAEEK